MRDQDYYNILGLAHNVSLGEIKRAYHRMARQYHPDLNAGDRTGEIKLKQINEAYAVLSNPGQREQYDRLYARKALQYSAVGVYNGDVEYQVTITSDEALR
jgi:molecular chaperone DnaJ